jgi:hypothetical protein
MERREWLKGAGAAAGLAMAFAGEAMAQGTDTHSDETVYELRVYHLNPGKLPLILERFRTKETAIFARLGMVGVAYWVPTEEPLAGKTLMYLLRHRSREAAKASWAAFSADPEWIALKAETEKDGPFLASREITFMKATDFSPRP